MANKLRKMLGAADSPYIVSLMRLIETQSKVTIAKWCMDYCEAHILPIFEKHCPGDERPRHAIEAARDWFDGKKKLPVVKNIILNECHAAARELDGNPAAQAAARACGQVMESDDFSFYDYLPYIIKGFGYMLPYSHEGKILRPVTPEQIGALKVIKIAIEIDAFWKAKRVEGVRTENLMDFYETVVKPIIDL